jgi:hypothetical protein
LQFSQLALYSSAWQLHDAMGNLMIEHPGLAPVKPDGFSIPYVGANLEFLLS